MRWDILPRWDAGEHAAFLVRSLLVPLNPCQRRLTYVRYFSSQLAYMPFLFLFFFSVYLFFCFYFNFELLINIHTAKLFKMDSFFGLTNYKNKPSLNKLSDWLNEQSCQYSIRTIPVKQLQQQENLCESSIASGKSLCFNYIILQKTPWLWEF